MAAEIKRPGSVAIASGWMGYVHVLRGQFDLAVPILERGSAVSHEHDLPHGIKANELYLALAYLFLGDHGRGADHLHRALEQRPGSFDLQWTRYGTITAAVHLAADQLGEARAAVTAGLQAASMRHAGAYMPTFLRLETEVRAADGANGARLERIEEALRLAAECGMRLEIAHCQLARGRLHAQDGRTQAATEAFGLAVQMYR